MPGAVDRHVSRWEAGYIVWKEVKGSDEGHYVAVVDTIYACQLSRTSSPTRGEW